MKLSKAQSDPYAQLRKVRMAQARSMLDLFVASGEDTMDIEIEIGDLFSGLELNDHLIKVLAQDQRDGNDTYAGIGVFYDARRDQVQLYRNPNL